MGAFEHFPYTNFHDLNLDWIIEKIREWEQSVKNFEAKFANIETDWSNIEKEWVEINREWKNIQSDWVRLTNEVNAAIAQIDAKIERGIGDYENASSQLVSAMRELIDNGDVVETNVNMDHQTLGKAGIGITNGVFNSAASRIYYYAVKAGEAYKISGDNYTNPYTTTGVSAAFSTIAPEVGNKPAEIILYGKTKAEDVDIYYTPAEDGYIWLCESSLGGGGLLAAQTAKFKIQHTDVKNYASGAVAIANNMLADGNITENITPLNHQTLSRAGIGIASGVFSSVASDLFYYAVTAGKTYKISGDNYTNPYTTTGVSVAFSKIAPEIGNKPAEIILYGKTKAEEVNIYYTPAEDGFIWLCESSLGGSMLTAAESAFVVPPRFKLIKNSTEPSTNTIDLFRDVEIAEEAYILINNPSTLSYDCDVYTESGTFNYSFTFPARTLTGTIHLVRYTDTDKWLLEAETKVANSSAVFRTGTVIFTSEHLTNLKITTDLSEMPLIPAGTRIVTIGK